MKRMKGIIKKLAVLVLALAMIAGPVTAAFAYANEEEDTRTEESAQTSSEETVDNTETDTEKTRTGEDSGQDLTTVTDENLSGDTTQKKDSTEKTERSSGEKIDRSDAFTTIGNAEVMDDITDDSTKEFLTIVTKNNQTFYIVIDRSSTTDNVYMLSSIDENDLQEFLSETKEAESTTQAPAFVLPEISKEAEETTAAESSGKEVEKKGISFGDFGGWLLVIAVAAAVLAAAYYLKIYRPRSGEDDDSGNEGLEDGYEEVDEDKE